MDRLKALIVFFACVVLAGFSMTFEVQASSQAFSGVGLNSKMGSMVVKNPYADIDWDRVNQYLANFHCHTIKSDGRAEPDELIYMYADGGYDILAIADHDNYYVARSGERDPGPTSETTWPWTRWIDEQPSQIWTRGEMETSAFYPDLGSRGMLAVRGNELSTNPHLVSLFNDCGFADANQTDEDRMGCIEAKGGLAFWAHPALYVPPHPWQHLFNSSLEEALAYYGDYLVRYDGLLGIEFNQNDLDVRMSESITIWDELLKRHYQDQDIFAFGNDDSHDTSLHERAVLTIVLAEDLTEEAVREALQRGQTFVGRRVDTYPRINSIEVDEEQNLIVVDIDNQDKITWIKDSQVYHVGNSIDYSDMDDAVLRFEITSANQIFYSQAFLIQNSSRHPKQLSIGCYNIRHGRGMDDVVDLGRIADVLATLDVQVVALQELDHFNNRNNVNQAAEIAQHLGAAWNSRFYKSIDWNEGQYGNAILYDSSALTLLDSKHIQLPGAEPRSAGIILFKCSSGFNFQLISTHLTSRKDEEHLRIESLSRIQQNLFENVPAVLAGDINAQPDSPAVKHMLDLGWAITNPLDRPTFRSDAPDRTIDYIAILHDNAFDVLDAQVLLNDLTQIASDHLPLVTRVMIVQSP